MTKTTRNALIGSIAALAIIGIAIWLFLGGGGSSEGPGGRDIAAGRARDAEPDAPSQDLASAAQAPSDAAGAAAETPDEVGPQVDVPPLLRGRVLGEGLGIPGATVRLFAVAEAERFLRGLEDLIPQGREMPDIPRVIERLRGALESFRALAIPATTDTAGEFEVRDIDPGGYFVLTLAGGWIFHYGDVVSLAIGETQELTIELERGARIQGTVVSPAGIAVPGATVVAEYRPPGMPGVGKLVRRGLRLINGEFLKGPFEARTDAAGAFVLDSLPHGVYDLAASAGGGVERGVESRLEMVQTGTTGAVVLLGDGGSLRGFFVDEVDLAVGGVTARLESVAERIQLPLPAAGFNDIANTVNRYLGEPPRVVVSSSDGSFVFSGLGEGKYQLTVEQPGFLRLVREAEVTWGEDATMGGLRLDRGQTIRGIVRTADGIPVEEAAVLGVPMNMNFLNMGIVANDFATGRLQVRSAADGSFVLSGLQRTKYRVIATRGGFAPAMATDITGDSEPLDLVLEPGVRLAGRVVIAGSEDGVVGVNVRCKNVRAKSDEDGRFVLDGVVADDERQLGPFGGFAERRPGGGGRIGVRAGSGDDAAGAEGAESEEPKPRLVRIRSEKKGLLTVSTTVDIDDPPEEVVVEISPAPAVQGIVYDPDGAPAPATLVRLTPWLPPEIDQIPFFDTALLFLGVAVSDREGRFRFENFNTFDESGRLRVIADHALWARGVSEGFTFDSGFDSDGQAIEVTLVAGATLRGKVTDGRQPIPNATVRLAPYREVDPQERMFVGMLGLPKGGDEVHTSSEGEFLYRQVVPGEYVVSVEVEGFTDSREERVVLAPNGESEVSFELDSGGSIFGVVVDAGGIVVEGARVRLLNGSEPDDRMLQAQKFLGGAFKSTVSAEDGAFRLDGLPAGLFTVLVDKPGFRRAELAEVAPGDRPLSLVLVRSAFIRGAVVDIATGGPVTTFSVDVREDGVEDEMRWRRKRQHTDSEGFFERADLAPGVYRVSVEAAGFVPASLELALAEGGVAEPQFALARSGRLEGVVTDKATGRPLAGARVRLVTGDPAPTTGERGRRRRADGDEPNGERGVPRVGDDAAKPAEKSPAELQAEDLSALREHFFASQFGGAVSTDANGAFVYDTVPREPITVVVTHEDYVQATRRGVEVGLGEAIQVDVGLEAGLSISGRVVDPSGEPLAGHAVFARGVSPANSAVRKSATTGDGGRFRIAGLDQGGYRLLPFTRGSGGGESAAAVQVEVGASVDDIELVLPRDSRDE